MSIVLLIGFLALCIAIEVGRNLLKKRAAATAPLSTKKSQQLQAEAIGVPQGIYFGLSHTWAHLQKTGEVRVGMDDFLKHVLGPVSRIGLKASGERVSKNDPLFDIEKNGRRLRVYSPLSGTIRRVNAEITGSARLAAEQPYDGGWVYEIEPDNWTAETQGLMLGSRARQWMKNELARLKDFLAFYMASVQTEVSPAILQEGGQVADRALENAPPDLWERFQNEFIDQMIPRPSPL